MLECESSTQLRSVQLERFLFLRSEFGEEILIRVFSNKIELIIIREKEKLKSEFTSLELIRVASFGGFQHCVLAVCVVYVCMCGDGSLDI